MPGQLQISLRGRDAAAQGGRPLADQGGHVRHDPDDPHPLSETFLDEGRGDSGRDGDDERRRHNGAGELIEDIRHVLRLDGENNHIGAAHSLPVVDRHGHAVGIHKLSESLFILVRHRQRLRLHQAAGYHPPHEGAPHLPAADHPDPLLLQHSLSPIISGTPISGIP